MPVLAGAVDSAERNKPELASWSTDNTHCNISDKNPCYCELTVLYWAWKNLRADYLGLVHYRRYFASRRFAGDKWNRVLRGEELARLLNRYDVLLPKPRHYFIETNHSQFVHAHGECALNVVRECLKKKNPEYLPDYDASMRKTSGHRFNMFVMRSDLLDAYCQWLFELLFEAEEELLRRGALKPRMIGYIAERLLDVWLAHNHISYHEIPVVFMERENWLKKIACFLQRKWSAWRRRGEYLCDKNNSCSGSYT